MTDVDYIVKVTALGNVLNRDVVEQAALEGRTVPPVVEYLAQGEKVKLNNQSPHTKSLLKAGSIEVPGESEKRESEALQARQDELKAEQDRLAAQAKSLKG